MSQSDPDNININVVKPQQPQNVGLFVFYFAIFLFLFFRFLKNLLRCYYPWILNLNPFVYITVIILLIWLLYIFRVDRFENRLSLFRL